MDDLEFQTRAYSDPDDASPDFTAAAHSSPERQQLLQEIRELDSQIRNTLHSVDASVLLAARLKKHATPAAATPARKGWMSRPVYALAASLVVAVGLGFSTFQSRPSAADIAFHDDLLQHVYREEPRYDGNENVSWSEINRVLAENGGHLIEDEQIHALRIKFVNNCGVGERGRGAHIVLEGSKGSVSVFFVKGPGVKAAFDVDDERFSGRIIPLGQGDMAIIAEKDEAIDGFQTLIAEHFEWQI